MTRDTAKPGSVPDTGMPGTDDTVCLVGLGYVGLPLAVAFDDEGYDVVGFDVDEDRVTALESDVDPTTAVGDDAVENSEVAFTHDASAIEAADTVIIAVPTPVTDERRPDLTYVRSAGRTVGSRMTAGTTVVLESTVYPGVTAEVLVPALEEASGLTAGSDFHVGYSPERASIGDTKHGLNDVVKVVSAFDDETLDELEALYGSIVDAGVYRAESVETAEAAKVIENVQRDVNIALMNELAMAFDHLDIDTQAVLDTAGTKWNFHDYDPGLVGGHCIPVDPHYFVDRLERDGFTPDLITTGRAVNRSVPKHVVSLVEDAFDERGTTIDGRRLLVLGLTYKPDVPDVRSTAIGDTISLLESAGATVVGHDPHASDEVIAETYGIETIGHPTFHGFDGVLLLTPHSVFETLDPADMAYRMGDHPVLVDVQGMFDGEDLEGLPMAYRSL